MPNDELIKTILTLVAGILSGYLVNRAQIRVAQIKAGSSKKSQPEVAMDVMVEAYEKAIKLTEQDRDRWKERALEAEKKGV